ncbi:hypothetical protein C8J57DRAFT_1513848 [Mycena rebaudengoi]|nr:hypothetical protein C8J57DRAFT_1513848 [Mycena rebaudengoi]
MFPAQVLVTISCKKGSSQDQAPQVTSACGLGFWVFWNPEEIGTYSARWTVEYGLSSEGPDAPTNPNTDSCGFEPYNLTSVEYARTFEVVETV